MLEPVPDRLLFFYLDKKRYKVVKGGRGGGKSENIARILIALCQTTPLKVLCAREYQRTIRDSVHSLLARIIRQKKLTWFFEIQETRIIGSNGSEIIFSGLQNIDNIKSLDQVDICWITEATSITKHSFQILTPSIRKSGSEIWIDFNPENEEDYVYGRFCYKRPERYESNNVILETINWNDNPFFPKELEIERTECLANNPDDYDWIWEGKVRKISEAIIFKDKVVVKEVAKPNIREVYYNTIFQGADFGFANDPDVLVQCYIADYEGKRSLYISHAVFGYNVETNEISSLFASVPDARKWLIKGDCSEPATISYLAQPYDEQRDEKGFNIVACKKGPGSVEAGIKILRSFHKIIVDPRCEELIKEFRQYSYKVDKRLDKILPIPLDENNHGIDAVRYAIDDYICGHMGGSLQYNEEDNDNDFNEQLQW